MEDLGLFLWRPFGRVSWKTFRDSQIRYYTIVDTQGSAWP